MGLNLKSLGYVDVMRYYVSYMDIEKDIVNWAQGKKPTNYKPLEFYMNSHMKIKRCFNASHEEIWRALMQYTYGRSNYDVQELSDYLKKDHKHLWSDMEGKNTIVASSKLLWLLDQETIIMDGRAARSLKVGESYKKFAEVWEHEYGKKVTSIKGLVSKMNKTKDIQLPTDEWFYKRIFDQYLWYGNGFY